MNHEDHIWVEVSFGWNLSFTTRVKQVLDEWSQQKATWKPDEKEPETWRAGDWDFHFVIPLSLAEAIKSELRCEISLHRTHAKGLSAFISGPAKQISRPEVPVLNQRLNIAIPGNALMAVRDVRLLEDGCTDELKSLLNDGWCILAVCPQAQRRPDYILGRMPEVVHEGEETVARTTQAAFLKCFQPTPIAPKDLQPAPSLACTETWKDNDIPF